MGLECVQQEFNILLTSLKDSHRFLPCPAPGRRILDTRL